MKTITYKGYQASVEFDDGSLFVKVLHIDDVLVAECDSAKEAEAVARELIDDYLADCAEEGRDPAKPFKGSFNIRIAPDLHKRAAMEAAEEGVSLNSWISNAIQEKVECSRLSERINGVLDGGRREMILHLAQAATNTWSHGQRLDRPVSVEVQKAWLMEDHGDRNLTFFPALKVGAFAKQRVRHG